MAVTLTSTELEDAVPSIDDTVQADRLLDVATELVNGFAPLAPDAVANEAVIRTAGWLSGKPSDSVRGQSVGDIEIQYASSEQSALRHSGAMSLLSRWKVRRAGLISGQPEAA